MFLPPAVDAYKTLHSSSKRETHTLEEGEKDGIEEKKCTKNANDRVRLLPAYDEPRGSCFEFEG